eukprot:scaffold87209_cov35-Cyclotella_meneghiniana.AAC.1
MSTPASLARKGSDSGFPLASTCDGFGFMYRTTGHRGVNVFCAAAQAHLLRSPLERKLLLMEG